MRTTLTIPEIKKLDNKDTVPAVEGTIKKVFDQKSGESEYGPWHLQNLILCEGENEVTMTWGGEESLKPMEGQRVRFECSESKHGKQGLKWEIRQANGKTYESIKITPTVKMTVLDSPQKVVSSAVEASSARPDALGASTQRKEEGYEDFRHALMRVLNAFWLIERGVGVESDQSKIDGFETSEAHLQAKCSTAFIHLDKLGLVKGMPDKPLWSIASRAIPAKELPKAEIDRILTEEEPF